MAAAVDSNFIKSNTKDGSYLKYCRSKGGAGLGLITVGIMLAGATAFLGISLNAAIDLLPQQTTMIYGTAAVFVIIFVIPGVILHKKRAAAYLDFFSGKSGYTPAQLKEMDKEVISPGSVLIYPFAKDGKTARSLSGVVTPHWCKLARNYNDILRLVDIAAIWFDPKPYIDNKPSDPSLFFIDSQGKMTYYFAQEAPAKDAIAEIAKRNPKTITVRKFTYNDQEYDAYKMPMQTAELYRTVY